MPGRTILGAGQYYWQQSGTASVASKAWSTLITYAIPVGRRVYIASGFVDAIKPGLFKLEITFPPITAYVIRFNTLFTFSLNPIGVFVVEESQTITLRVYNHLVGSVTFGAILMGFEEVI